MLHQIQSGCCKAAQKGVSKEKSLFSVTFWALYTASEAPSLQSHSERRGWSSSQPNGEPSSLSILFSFCVCECVDRWGGQRRMLAMLLDYFTPSFWRHSLFTLPGQCAPELPVSAFPVLELQACAAGPGFLCGCCGSQLISSSLHLNDWTISSACGWQFDRQSPLLFLWAMLCVDIYGHCLWCWELSPWPCACWASSLLLSLLQPKHHPWEELVNLHTAISSLRETGTLSSGMLWKPGPEPGWWTARKFLGVSSVSEERHRNPTRLIAC